MRTLIYPLNAQQTAVISALDSMLRAVAIERETKLLLFQGCKPLEATKRAEQTVALREQQTKNNQ